MSPTYGSRTTQSKATVVIEFAHSKPPSTNILPKPVFLSTAMNGQRGWRAGVKPKVAAGGGLGNAGNR